MPLTRQILILLMFLFAPVAMLRAVPPGKSGWKMVDDAMEKGLPKTAIRELIKVEEDARQNGNDAALVHAITMRINLEASIRGAQPAEKIKRMKAEIARASPNTRPLLQTILAKWYWTYFTQNRWRFAQRTSSEAADQSEDDLTTWDLARILKEIDDQFQLALGEKELLQKIKTADFSDLLEAGNTAEIYRPTLYDIVVQAAIDFYSAGEHGGVEAADALKLDVQSPIFDPLEAFLAFRPNVPQIDGPAAHSVEIRAVKSFQEVLNFHRHDGDPGAKLDWDLKRLRFGYNRAVGEGKLKKYQSALRRFASTHNQHPVSSLALHALAQTYQSQSELAEAHQVAKQGLDRFPESVGGKRCFNLIAQIEAPELNVTSDHVWSTSAAPLHIQYRNLTAVHFRVIKREGFKELLRRGNQSNADIPFLDGSTQTNRSAKTKRLLRLKPVMQWSEKLDSTDDYQTANHQADLSRMKDLPKGAYWLVSSSQPDFRAENNQMGYTSIWRSELALVIRTRSPKGFVEGIVTDAELGEPIAGAQIDAYQRGQNGKVVKGRLMTTTNQQGFFQLKIKPNHSVQFLVRTKDDQLASIGQFSTYGNRQKNSDRRQTVFFTDRSIYRPGQSLHYKGVSYVYNQQSNRYEVLAGERLTVVYRDVSGQEIERRQHQTNDFGSFSGSFSTPRDRALGAMRLQVEGIAGGQALIRVEEYKRPKFRVELESPKQSVKLGDRVIMTGSASAYTGAPIDSAKVAYRVVRNVRYAPWWYQRCWWMPVQPAPSKEITSGTVTTNAQGRFEIPFVAQPDASVQRASEPTFTYTVHADVTDSAGETRSDQANLSLGYSAIQASLSAQEYLTTDTPIQLNVRVEGLHGGQNIAKGTVKIYRLKQPNQVATGSVNRNRWSPRPAKTETDPTNPQSWEQDELLRSIDFETTATGKHTMDVKLPAGIFRAVTAVSDTLGNQATAFTQMRVIDLKAKQFGIKLPFVLSAKQWTAKPGETFQAVWGSGYESARVLLEVEHHNNVISQTWSDPGRTQAIVEVPIDESMRGGVVLRTTMIRNNRAVIQEKNIDVPWDNQQLEITWERFTSKLQPAAQETWTARVKSKDDRPVTNAEMVATLYDASLEAFARHSMRGFSHIFYRNRSGTVSTFQNHSRGFQRIASWTSPELRDGGLTYWRFPDRFFGRFGYGYSHRLGRAAPVAAAQMEMSGSIDSFDAMQQVDSSMPFGAAKRSRSESTLDGGRDPFAAPPGPPGRPVNFDNISIRKNLNETAFFLPSLTTGDDGSVEMSFTMPEALTQWKFIGFAHDAKLRGGMLTASAVTTKDLMVQPNPPRFVREGDELEFTVKVTNQSPTVQNGTARLTFSDYRNGESVDAMIANTTAEQDFSVPAGQSSTLSWKIQIPAGLDLITYKAVGSTGKLSDGEAGYLPVLTKQVLVEESLPLPIRGKQSKPFDFERLVQSKNSNTITHKTLTAQVVSNPSWYAVMSLPYLMEYPLECSEQTFNRLYANSLARQIVTSDDKIERVFETWRATPALDSPLEKNEELRSVALLETPWKKAAVSASQARRDVGILFQQNRLENEVSQAFRKLAQMQMADGSWPWFDGGRSNEYLTLYIATGMGRLKHLGVEVDPSVPRKAFAFLDAWMDRKYRKLTDAKKKRSQLSPTVALYLYGRSFFVKELPIADKHQAAFEFWQDQAKRHWLEMRSRQNQGHIALAMNRLGETNVAKAIAASLKERSLHHEELGMHWEDAGPTWWWYHAPVESQAMMIEVFDEVANDQASVQACQVWLIKQRQTHAWPTTKSTADAVYALLLRGSDLLASNELVRLSLGGEAIDPKNVEAGTGFYEKRFVNQEITPDLGHVKMTKVDDGVAWGSLHWQYLEDIDKVTANQTGPLKLSKRLFIKKNTNRGPKLIPLDDSANIGDELVVRLIVRTDRDMEYVHLKDHRGSGTEPTNVLSRYRSQDGLWYYESTRDTASHFFIDYLPKGDYVLEYSTRIQLRGRYQTGFAHIECMYAPEFDSHSQSIEVIVE